MRSNTERRLRRAVAQRAGCGRGEKTCVGCTYCGYPVKIEWLDAEPRFMVLAPTPTPAHLDHVIPESRNGPTSLDNTVIACNVCNLAKGDSAFGDPGFQRWLWRRRTEVADIFGLAVA